MAMAKQQKTKTDKPQEEFRDDSSPNRDETPSNRKRKSEEREEKNYDEWTLEQLQKEAQRQGLEEGMTMDKEQLIRNLRG